MFSRVPLKHFHRSKFMCHATSLLPDAFLGSKGDLQIIFAKLDFCPFSGCHTKIRKEVYPKRKYVASSGENL